VRDPRSGLCADCQHCRIVKSARSTFYMCLRSLTDPEYRKYPPLPVLRCPGYQPVTPAEAERADPGKVEWPDGKLTE
jgi:hypothetical protein